MTERIKPQMIVEKGGRRGVTAPDFMSCCLPIETPVIWSGESAFEGTDTDTLTVIGPEDAKADFHKCGAGREAQCCKFLTGGPLGACCERFSGLRYTLIFKSGMSAQREPIEPYPACQKFPSKP